MAQRAEAKNEPFEDPLEVRIARHDAYMAMAKQGRFTPVDAEQSIEDVTRSILDILREA